jgi:sigma-B regulation protein RsbU (phosphoserine phosphatase)
MRERHASMAMAVVALEDGHLEIASAGMPPILIRRAARACVDEILLSGAPLGTLLATSYDVQRVPVNSGDAVLMMSDGVIEAIDEGGEPFGYDRAAAYLGDCERDSAEGLVAGVMEAVVTYSGRTAPADDVTVLALVIN